MIFVRVHDVCLTSWFSFHYFFLTFMKLQVSWFLLIWIFFAYFHGFLSFFMTFARGVFSWRLCVFSLIGTISGFWSICIKLTTFHDFCVFSWCWQNFMIFTCFNEDGKILCFLGFSMKSAIFHDFFFFFYEFGKISWFLCFFYEVGKISWFLCTFMKLTKFYDFFVISWSWQNLMIFVKIYEIGKIP